MHYAPATQNDSTTFPSLGAVDTADATGPSCRPLVACKPSVNPPNRAARVAFLNSSTWAGAVTSICRSRSSTFSNKRCFTLACTSGPLGFAASSSFNASRNQESHRIARVASTSASGAACDLLEVPRDGLTHGGPRGGVGQQGLRCEDRTHQYLPRPGWSARWHQGGRRGDLDRQLHALRSRLHRLGAENPATLGQPVRHAGVTHVLGTPCHPCFRAVQGKVWRRGRDSNPRRAINPRTLSRRVT